MPADFFIDFEGKLWFNNGIKTTRRHKHETIE